MATITAIGPAFAVDGPLPVAPPYRLLSVDGVLAGEERWLNGVNVWGYPCGTPANWDPCNDPGEITKDDDSVQPTPRFDAFQAYLPVTCMVTGARIPDDLEARARAALMATASMAVEASLAQGTGVSTNPYFGDTDLDILGGGAVAPDVGLAYLSNAIGATGREGLIHMDPATAAWLGFDSLNTDGANIYVQGTGMPVAVGDGYIGSDPASGSTPAAGQSWMFATGPVRVYMSEMELVGPTVAQSLDRSDNTLTFRAEVGVLAMWDTCLQAGVLVDWSPT